MGPIDKLLRLERKLVGAAGPEMRKWVERAADKQRETMADLNREQLEEGKRPDGSDIAPEYTPLTVRLKQEKGQPTDKVTLLDTGDYYSGVIAKKYQGIYELQSTDSKDQELQDKYGDVLGLSPENLHIVSVRMLPDLIRSRNRYFGI